MSRTNIVEILDQKENISSQINKIEELLSEVSVDNSIPEDIVDMYCMREWKARGRCTSCRRSRCCYIWNMW